MTLVERFRESMEMNLERWRDGTGYDLEALAAATPGERAQIETLLLQNGVRDWRDVQALAALDTPDARQALRQAHEGGDARLKVALMSHAAHLISDGARTAALVQALRVTQVFGGLTQALLEVEDHHPPAVIEALLRGVLQREGAIAADFAAMLMYLHGQAPCAYDIEQRDFFNRFQSEDRQAPFAELCHRIGLDADTRARVIRESARS